MENRLSRYYRARRKFSTIVYVLTLIFCVLAILQWALILEINSIRKFLVLEYYVAPTFLLISMVIITFFVLFDSLRFLFPVNWILTVLTIELIIWGSSRVAIAGKPIYFYSCCIAICVFMAIFVILGSCLRHDLTLDIVVICILAGIFIVISVILLMIFLVTYMPYILCVYAIFAIITVILFVMYHAQTINGGRYAEMRLDDVLLAVLILFADYVILLMSTYYFVGKLADYAFGQPIFNTVEYKYGNGSLAESNSTDQSSPCVCPRAIETGFLNSDHERYFSLTG